MENQKQKIAPFLWYDNDVDEVVKFYSEVFRDNMKVLSKMDAPGNITSVTIQIYGQQLIIFNGGPQFKLTESFSLFVSCDTQAEIDILWEELSAGGQKSRCGWLKDKFGLWWQIVPPVLSELLQHKDAEKRNRVLQAMLKMDKLDINTLKNT